MTREDLHPVGPLALCVASAAALVMTGELSP
jgi:hypothetical protein